MATVQSVIDSARYDLVDFVDGVGVGIEFDDAELLDYMNRMVGLLDSNLSSLNSDLVESKDETHETTTGQDYVDLSSTLNSGNWLDIRSVWLGSNKLEKVSLDALRCANMHRSGNATPTIWALSNRKIMFPQGCSAITDLSDGYASTDWANVDINAYDETTDVTITANAVAQYCTLPVASAPTTAGQKYRMKYTVANLVSTWTLQDFTGAQDIGTVDAAEADTFNWTVDSGLTGGYRLTSVANDSSGDFTLFKLYNFADVLTIFYDKKTASLALTDSMPYNDTFNEFLREMLVLCAKAKKEGILSQADGMFNTMFRSRAMQEEISRGFIPRTYNYMEF